MDAPDDEDLRHVVEADAEQVFTAWHFRRDRSAGAHELTRPEAAQEPWSHRYTQGRSGWCVLDRGGGLAGLGAIVGEDRPGVSGDA